MPRKSCFTAQRGDPRRIGVSVFSGGMLFCTVSPPGERLALQLYERGSTRRKQLIEIPDDWRCGNLAGVFIPDLRPEMISYAYLRNGVPQADPYATCVREGRCYPSAEPEAFTEDTAVDIPMEDLLIYKLHVRGFTMDQGAGVRHPGTVAGLTEKLPYIAGLGFNCISCMPIYAYRDERPGGRRNYWGYAAENYYFSPRAELFATEDPTKELRALIRELHRLQMLFCMEVFVPTGEDAMRLLAALRHWKYHYHVDAFHLLGDAVPQELILSDPLLADTKIFVTYRAESGRETEERCANLHDGFLQAVRGFLRRERGATEKLSLLLRGRNDERICVQYAANSDGFTLYDTFAYSRPHNGEDAAKGGPRINLSMNCGAEGETKSRKINALRKQQIRNAMAAVFLSQGIPLLNAGDEFGNSQTGNNNAYAADDPTGWVNWKRQRRFADLREYLKTLIRIRKQYPILRGKVSLTGTDRLRIGLPDVSVHGLRPWLLSEGDEGAFLMLFNGAYAKKGDPHLAVVMNACDGIRTITLPPEAAGEFHCLQRSGNCPETLRLTKEELRLSLPAHCFAVYAGGVK